MNEICIGRIVVSRAGHDKGNAHVVVGLVDEAYVLLADGDLRKIAKPKKKKRMHVFATPCVSEALQKSILKGDKPLDSDIRKALDGYRVSNRQEEEGYIVEAGRH